MLKGAESHNIHIHHLKGGNLLYYRNGYIISPSMIKKGLGCRTICVIRAMLLLLLHMNPTRHSHGSCRRMRTPANRSAVFLK